MSTLKELRERLVQKASDAAAQRNEFEFVPEVGKKVTVRFLPPTNPDDLFYQVFSYHYIPNIKKYLYTERNYVVDGIKLPDPIDEAVSSWYSTAKKTNDDNLYKIAGTLKRKKHYFFQILLVDEPDPEKKFRILVDRSNNGKLARLICVKMGIPFFVDPETNWVDKTTLDIDEDKRYFDLLDTAKGHDFKIVKTQKGKESWDISYDDSFVIENPRPLTKEEKVLLDKRVDLKDYIKPEKDYNTIKGILENFIESMDGNVDMDEPEEKAQVEVVETDEDEEKEPEKEAPKSKGKKQVKQKLSEASDEEIDEMLKDIN